MEMGIIGIGAASRLALAVIAIGILWALILWAAA